MMAVSSMYLQQLFFSCDKENISVYKSCNYQRFVYQRRPTCKRHTTKPIGSYTTFHKQFIRLKTNNTGYHFRSISSSDNSLSLKNVPFTETPSQNYKLVGVVAGYVKGTVGMLSFLVTDHFSVFVRAHHR